MSSLTPPASLTLMVKTDHSCNYLPGLPFELQFSILREIPPNELFILRRVSHSWNYMLCKHYLLEAINATLPFLTSAPDLTSRIKRRMRMARGKPVWVKPFHEVVPWVSSWPKNAHCHDRKWVRYSDWWFVWLIAQGDLRLNWRSLNTQGIVEVDVLAVMKRVNLPVYQ